MPIRRCQGPISLTNELAGSGHRCRSRLRRAEQSQSPLGVRHGLGRARKGGEKLVSQTGNDFPLTLPRGAAGGEGGASALIGGARDRSAVRLSHLFFPFPRVFFSSLGTLELLFLSGSVFFFSLWSLVGWKTKGWWACGWGFYEVDFDLAAWLGIDMGPWVGFWGTLASSLLLSLFCWLGVWVCWSAFVFFFFFSFHFHFPFSRFLLQRRLLFSSSSLLIQLGFFRFFIYPTLFRLDSTVFCSSFVLVFRLWGQAFRKRGRRKGWAGFGFWNTGWKALAGGLDGLLA